MKRTKITGREKNCKENKTKKTSKENKTIIQPKE